MLKVLVTALTLAATPALALDATETLSDFTIDGDIQQTPSQILIRNGVIKYMSSTKGAASKPLKLNYANSSTGAAAVCVMFGATKLVGLNVHFDEESIRKVLVVEIKNNRPVFNWVSSSDAAVVDEILCEL